MKKDAVLSIELQCWWCVRVVSFSPTTNTLRGEATAKLGCNSGAERSREPAKFKSWRFVRVAASGRVSVAEIPAFLAGGKADRKVATRVVTRPRRQGAGRTGHPCTPLGLVRQSAPGFIGDVLETKRRAPGGRLMRSERWPLIVACEVPGTGTPPRWITPEILSRPERGVAANRHLGLGRCRLVGSCRYQSWSAIGFGQVQPVVHRLQSCMHSICTGVGCMQPDCS